MSALQPRSLTITLPSEGAHTFSIRALQSDDTAAAGFCPGTEPPFPNGAGPYANVVLTLDTIAPSAPTVSGPANLDTVGANAGVNYQLSGETSGTFSWSLVGPNVNQTGTGPTANLLNTAGDGEYGFTGTQSDVAGNTSPPTQRKVRLARPPTVVPGVVASPTPGPVFAIVGTDISWVFRRVGVIVHSGAGSTASLPASGVADGAYTFEARQNFALGASVLTTIPFTLGRSVAPEQIGVPTALGNQPLAITIAGGGTTRPTVSWSEDADAYVWQVTRGDIIVQGPTRTTASSVRLAKLLSGSFAFQVRPIAADGTVGGPSRVNFAIDRGRSVQIAGKALIIKPYGPLMPGAGLVVSRRSQLALRWTYHAARKSRLFNVQVFDATGKKIYSAFPRGTSLVLPPGLAKRGRRLYWQVWPYWESGGYARKPLGVSYIDISKTITRLRTD